MSAITKTCTVCGETKELACFSRKSGYKFGVESRCRVCEAARKKAYYAVNRDRVAAYNKVYHAANKERRAAYYKAYYAANKDRKASYVAHRRKEDPQFRLTCLLRSRLRDALRNRQKTGSAVQDLGMPIPAFLVYLDLDCLDKYGISYTGNEAKFHLDHIRPLVSFDLEDPEQLRQAVRWDNIQVLTVEENLAKGGK